MRTLIVVDMQKDFVDGALGTKEAQAIVPAVCRKIQSFDGDIILTQDTHRPDYLDTQEGHNLPVPHCVKDTDGWKLDDAVSIAISDRDDQRRNGGKWTPVYSVTKPTFGSVDLGQYLCEQAQSSDIDEIVLIGLCTDICVISNALLLKAFLPEVKITVDAACCAGVTPESHENALRAMRMCQINIENWEG